MFRAVTGPGGGSAIKGTPVQINGVIYLTVPDHVWAIDARSGREIWHFTWQSKGGSPPLAGGLIYDQFASYFWLYAGAAGMGLASFLTILAFRPFPKIEPKETPAAAA